MKKTIPSCITTFVLSFSAFIVHSTYAQGVLIAQHSDSADPTTEGFSLVSMGNSARVGPIIGDMGFNSWITAVSNVNNNVTYRSSLSPDQQTQLAGADWVLSLGLRVVASSGVFGNNYASISTGSERFSVFIGSRPDGDPFVLVGSSSLSPVFEFDGGGPGYHEYQLRYSAASGTSDLWADGMLRLSGLSAAGLTSLSHFEWGQSQGGPSQANWNFVSLQIVPEPSPLLLLTIGMSSLLLCRSYVIRR